MQRRLRLRQSADFGRLRRDGQTKRHPALILSYAPNSLDHNRYGFITGKRLGNAITRNRCRRLLREATRLLHPQLKQGYDVALIARPALVGESYDDVQRIVRQLYARASLLFEEQSS